MVANTLPYQSMRVAKARMGDKAGKPRLYISGKWLLDYAFDPGVRFTLDAGNGWIVLSLHANGERTVSGKKGGTVAVIDINSAELVAAFGDTRDVMVEATAARIRVRRRD